MGLVAVSARVPRAKGKVTGRDGYEVLASVWRERPYYLGNIVQGSGAAVADDGEITELTGISGLRRHFPQSLYQTPLILVPMSIIQQTQTSGGARSCYKGHHSIAMRSN